MRRVNFLLRIWVIVGAALLLLQTPKGGPGYAEYSPGSCINYATGPQTCPSGCTGSSFTQTTQASGNGISYLKPTTNTTPCGSAKQGKTCSNPTQYTNVWDFQDCCAQLRLDCTGVGYSYMNCCNASAVCMSGTCCIPDSWPGCGSDSSNCCSESPCVGNVCQGSDCSLYGDPCGDEYPCCYPGVCHNGMCCPPGCPMPACSDISAYCSAQCGCPYSNTCSDCYDGCVSGMSSGCAGVCEACGICC
jgi:hypothetical protein